MWVQLVAVLVVLFVTRWFWRRVKYDLHKVPSPPGLPLLGHTLSFMFGHAGKQAPQWLNSSFKQLGNPRLMRVDMMGDVWLFVADLPFIKSTMLSRTNSFPKIPSEDEVLMITCGSRKIPRSLLSETTLSPYLLSVRRVYTTAFQSGNLKAAMPRMKRVTQNLFRNIEQKRTQGSIDIQELSEKATLDTIGEMAFYSDFGGLDGSRRLGDLIESVGLIGRERLSNPLKKLQCLFFPHSKEVLRQQAEIRALRDEWDQLMVDIDAKEDPPEGVEPIWYAMKQLNDPESGMRLDKESLRCEMATVVAAGMATTAHQLSWTLALLAGYPRVLKQLVEELVEHDLCGSDMRDITFDDFSALTYLSAVVKEGLRLAHIVAFGLPSVVPRDMNILGYRVPKGTLIVCPGNQGYSTEADWGDPEAFRPERWLTNEDMSQKYYLPFSVGPRDCPGQRLALFILRLFIAEFVRRYELCLEGTYADLRVKARESIVTVAQGGIWMNFTPRTPST